MEADIRPVADRGENTARMEPLLLGETSRHRAELTDIAVDLAALSTGFRRSLPEGVRIALADLVRAMNCYYSNLIEGHDTHPVDIERALNNDYSRDPHKRELQLEAKAHIDVQRWIDAGGLSGRALTVAGIREVHERFCVSLPEELLWVEEPDTGERMKVLPGDLRTRDVRVGQHVAVSPGAVSRFMARFEAVYSSLGRTESILSTAAAHHRLVWIHPFLDGNGRVARLVSHASLLEMLDSGGIWSIARGLARSVGEYKEHLANCDLPKRNDLDGRGSLSEEALAAFTRYFLSVCIDQVKFMEDLVQPDRLRARILMWVEEEIRVGALPAKSGNVLEAVLYRGELPRGDVASVVGTGERQARRVVSALLEKNVLLSDSSRASLRLTFPAALASRWMPGLFPDKPAGAS
jgi:Fic family protein